MPRGFSTSGDFLTRTVDGYDLDKVWDEYIAILKVWNEGRNSLTSLLTFPTVIPGEAVSQALAGDEFELASEFGVPKSTRAATDVLSMGFPLEWFDLGIRYTEAFLRDAPVSQVNAQHNAALEANVRLHFKKVMSALFTKTTIATRPTNENGTSIYSLWDGESDAKPPAFAGRTFTSGHTHFLTSASTQIDGIDLRDLINHITEHGYGTSANERVVIMVHPNQGDAIRGLRVAGGSPFDFISAAGAPAYLTTEMLVGDRPPSEFQGLPIIGSFGNALIHESYWMPAGYVAAVASSGENSARNPLAIRRHVRKEYQGLRIIPGTNSRYPLIDATYAEGLGVAVRNRGAAAVMQVTTSSTYTNPTI
ncbi:hypothetical protein [Herbiconiux sp. YIM B11900]|uniref:hypothetical protein n=1 Tax=Herbiconiux sp. YIM B11900 TaxID=3404131 RepID=UPI003F84ED26